MAAPGSSHRCATSFVSGSGWLHLSTVTKQNSSQALPSPPPFPTPLRQSYRNAGIASRLVRLVVRHAAEAGCRCVYLHVISYNTTAIAFYRRLGFRDVALLPNFYVIRWGSKGGREGAGAGRGQEGQNREGGREHLEWA